MRRTTAPSRSRKTEEAQPSPMANVFWLAYQEISEEDRDAFWGKLLENEELRGELLDTILMVERREGPYHPEYETYLTELEQERAAKVTGRG